MVDGTLVFGTPVLAFALQSQLVRGSSYGLAISAAALALFYAAVATSLMRRKGPALRLFTEAFTALAVVFTTLALPLALDARWTAAAWALEGAALIWTGTRQSRRLPTLAGVALLLLSGAAFGLSGWQAGSGPPVLNGNVLGGALLALSALFGARQPSRSGASLGAQQRAAALDRRLGPGVDGAHAGRGDHQVGGRPGHRHHRVGPAAQLAGQRQHRSADATGRRRSGSSAASRANCRR